MTVEQDPHWAASVRWLVEVLKNVDNSGTVLQRTAAPVGVPAPALARAAAFHGVAGFARLALDQPPPELLRVIHAAQARHLRALDDLRLVVAALAAAEVDVLVAKGPALVATCYQGPQLRSYVDLDLLIRPRDLRRAVEALEHAGCTLLDANWPLLTQQDVKELFVQGPAGGAVDLHWGLGRNVGTAAPVDRLMARAVEIEGPTGTRYRTLAPWDMVAEVAVHAALSGGHRLVWLTDLRGAVDHARETAGSENLQQVAGEWHARPAIDLMARRAHRTIGMPLPGRPLRPGAFGLWSGLARLSDAVAPPPLVGEGQGASRLIARSCRPTAAGSIAAAVGKGRNWLTEGRGGDRESQVLNRTDDPRFGFYPAGGRGGRDAFFDRVAGTRD